MNDNKINNRRTNDAAMLAEMTRIGAKMDVFIARMEPVIKDVDKHDRILEGYNGTEGHKTIIAGLKQQVGEHRKALLAVGGAALAALANVPTAIAHWLVK